MIDPRDPSLGAVLADPDSDAARLALAQALRARGDAQGELIELQVEATKELRKYGPTPDYRRMFLRAQELLAQHAEDWTASVKKLAANPILIRGLVEGVTIDARRYLSAAPALYKLAPIRQLVLVDTDGLIQDIANSPYLDQIVSIIFYNKSKNAPIGDSGVSALAKSDHVGKIKRLGLATNDIGPAGLDALASSKRLPNLVYVDLGGNRFESPVETYGTDAMTGLVVREGVSLPASGEALEAKYGRLAWLHGPSQLPQYPPGDADL